MLYKGGRNSYATELLRFIVVVHTKDVFLLRHYVINLILKTLGITADERASILHPMVGSCFSAKFLKAWNRNNIISTTFDAKE